MDCSQHLYPTNVTVHVARGNDVVMAYSLSTRAVVQPMVPRSAVRVIDCNTRRSRQVAEARHHTSQHQVACHGVRQRVQPKQTQASQTQRSRMRQMQQPERIVVLV
ncbi:hypothetical protein Q31b_52950 [Novipirellula aureliae]|uniref:Uncharacterized protein n=1 Tax=Novipirellula aureliae TaxID=2527966 RepID=A0A5C6DK11_9BACT|nr:hypothetical protein Q31b_52950 [Novipirellula aureliae]